MAEPTWPTALQETLYRCVRFLSTLEPRTSSLSKILDSSLVRCYLGLHRFRVLRRVFTVVSRFFWRFKVLFGKASPSEEVRLSQENDPMIERVNMEDFTGVADNGQEDTMVEAIKISATTKTKNIQEDGGASDVLQAVLNSSSSNSEQSKYSTPEPEETSDATTVTSVGRKFGWWNLLESATLQQKIEDISSPNIRERAVQRWSRLEKKAAKVGRGLSKDENALKLGLQHWLEAIDPKHRYGHNLNFYYAVWIKSSTREPFYYWLDVGEGKDIDLEQCPRSKLEKELVKYLSPKEREAYEVIVEDGKLLYRITRQPVHTPKGDRWIFVMSPSGKFYVAKKKKGKFQHSSFLAGGVTTAAGRLGVNHGVLELMEAHSGHYLPTPENFRALIETLTSNGADLTVAKVHLESEEEVQKRDAGQHGGVTVATVNNSNETAFEALLASAGFSIRCDNAQFSRSDSESEGQCASSAEEDTVDNQVVGVENVDAGVIDEAIDEGVDGDVDEEFDEDGDEYEDGEESTGLVLKLDRASKMDVVNDESRD